MKIKSKDIMNTNPLISVIIPAYNRETHIKECLDSIINQTYKNIEIIVIDDGSTDNTASILDEYERVTTPLPLPPKKIIIIHQEHKGVSAARNTGIRVASAEWIKFVDSDDVLKSNCVEVLIKTALEKNDPKLILYTNYDLVDSRENILKRNVCKDYNYLDQKSINVIMLTNFNYSIITTLIHKSAFDYVMFDESLKIGEEEILCRLCIIYEYKIHFIDQSLAKVRKHQDSLQVTSDICQETKNINSNILKELSFYERFWYKKSMWKTYSNRNRFRMFYQSLLYSTIGQSRTKQLLKLYRKIKH